MKKLKKQKEGLVYANMTKPPSLQTQIKAMISILPQKIRLFYAIEANSDANILESMLPHIDGFEVASLEKLRKVREVSTEIPVLFSGSGKQDDELEQALQVGVSYVCVKSLLELRKLIYVASDLNQDINTLIRVNLHSHSLPVTSVTIAEASSGLYQKFFPKHLFTPTLVD